MVYISQDDSHIAPFRGWELRGCSENYKVPDFWSVNVLPQECLIPQAQVLSEIPKSLPKTGNYDFWFRNDEELDLVSYKLPSGILQFRFERGGLKALRGIDMIGRIDPTKDDVFSLWSRGARLAPFNRCGITSLDLEKAVGLLTQAINLDSAIPDLFRDRARAFVRLGKFQEALEDSNKSVSLGGKPYLRERAAVESEMGKLKEAISDYLECIGDRKPCAEMKPYWISLAKVYIKASEFQKSLIASQNAMIGSTENTEAKFLRAQAKYGLHEKTSALSDAAEAAHEYFTQARIVRRDEVNSWIQSIGKQ